jgi:hypothetical protein
MHRMALGLRYRYVAELGDEVDEVFPGLNDP